MSVQISCDVCSLLVGLGVDKKQVEDYHNGFMGVEDFQQVIQDALYRFWSKRDE